MRSPAVAPIIERASSMSTFGGKADISGCQSKLAMSAFRSKADITWMCLDVRY